MSKIELTIKELESMLTEQKLIMIERLAGGSGYYNTETTEGYHIPLTIDKEKFKEQGLTARFPNEFNVLKKYIKDS